MKVITAVLFGTLFFLTSCSNRDQQVDKKAKASFSADGYDKATPCNVTFINNSSNVGSTECTWDFGDGGTSNEFNPTHTYSTWGYFTVTLKVNGVNGRDSVCKILSLSQAPPVNKTAFNYYQEKCSGYPVGVSLRGINPLSTSPVWDVNGLQGLSSDLIVSLPSPGDYTVKFSTILGGVRDTAIKIIRVQ
ncbi:MAG: PKD domain-containing protein [Bacteroidetes bacterium]|nr:PKD domain-containing protein [Bacteroidota bacterium]